MELKLNKIDTNLRQKIEEQTKDGKVHSKDGIKIYTQINRYKYRDAGKNNKKNNSKSSFKDIIKEQTTVTVEGYKTDTVEVEVTQDKNTKENYRGIFIDVKK